MSPRPRPPIPTLQADGTVKLATIHLSPFAPLCEALDVMHHDRWPVLIGLTPAQVLRNVIQRLDRKPTAIRLFAHPDGTCDVHSNTPERLLLAVIFDVPTAALVEAHEALVAGIVRAAPSMRRAA